MDPTDAVKNPELVRSRIEQRSDLLHQSPGRKRFLKKVDLLVHGSLVNDGVLGVSRNVERLEARPFLLQPPGQLPAAHLRHHDIGHEQMDPSMPGTRDNESFSPTGSLQDSVSPRPENPGRKLSHSRLTVRDEHRHTFTGPRQRRVVARQGYVGYPPAREGDPQNAALVQPRVNKGLG